MMDDEFQSSPFGIVLIVPGSSIPPWGRYLGGGGYTETTKNMYKRAFLFFGKNHTTTFFHTTKWKGLVKCSKIIHAFQILGVPIFFFAWRRSLDCCCSVGCHRHFQGAAPPKPGAGPLQ